MTIVSLVKKNTHFLPLPAGGTSRAKVPGGKNAKLFDKKNSTQSERGELNVLKNFYALCHMYV